MTPTETLRAAATKLRTLAQNATEATRSNERYTDDERPTTWAVELGTFVYGNESDLDGRVRDLIAALGPEEAGLIADWLDQEADDPLADCPGRNDPAAALARRILGEDS